MHQGLNFLRWVGLFLALTLGVVKAQGTADTANANVAKEASKNDTPEAVYHGEGPPPVAPPPVKGSPLEHLANDVKLDEPTVGYKQGSTGGQVYFIGHRFEDDAGGSGWGWIKKNGSDWGSAQWVALFENGGKGAAPYRKLKTHGGDVNWEYKFWGSFAPYKAYDPHLDEMVPVFMLQGYEVLGLKPALKNKPGPSDRVYHRPSGASSRSNRPIMTDPGVD